MAIDRVLDALNELTFWLEDGDLGGVDVGLDILATEMIRAKIFDRKQARAVSKLSELLRIPANCKQIPEDAVKSVEDIEACLSAARYGAFSEELLEKVNNQVASFTYVLEQWLTELADEEA